MTLSNDQNTEFVSRPRKFFSIVLPSVVVAGIAAYLFFFMNEPDTISTMDTPDSSPSLPPPESIPSPVPEKTLGTTPAPDTAPGFNEVTTRMQELLALGCTHVLHRPTGVKGTTVWTPTFPDEKDGACLNVIAATGTPDKALTALIRTPSGEQIDAPTSGSLIEFIYCAANPGPHSVNVISPTNDRYTFAAIDCPRAIAENLQKKNTPQ